MERGTATTIRDGHAVSRKLIEDTKWVSREVEKVIEDVGEEITALGKRIETGENKQKR